VAHARLVLRRPQLDELAGAQAAGLLGGHRHGRGRLLGDDLRAVLAVLLVVERAIALDPLDAVGPATCIGLLDLVLLHGERDDRLGTGALHRLDLVGQGVDGLRVDELAVRRRPDAVPDRVVRDPQRCGLADHGALGRPLEPTLLGLAVALASHARGLLALVLGLRERGRERQMGRLGVVEQVGLGHHTERILLGDVQQHEPPRDLEVEEIVDARGLARRRVLRAQGPELQGQLVGLLGALLDLADERIESGVGLRVLLVVGLAIERGAPRAVVHERALGLAQGGDLVAGLLRAGLEDPDERLHGVGVETEAGQPLAQRILVHEVGVQRPHAHGGEVALDVHRVVAVRTALEHLAVLLATRHHDERGEGGIRSSIVELLVQLAIARGVEPRLLLLFVTARSRRSFAPTDREQGGVTQVIGLLGVVRGADVEREQHVPAGLPGIGPALLVGVAAGRAQVLEAEQGAAELRGEGEGEDDPRSHGAGVRGVRRPPPPGGAGFFGGRRCPCPRGQRPRGRPISRHWRTRAGQPRPRARPRR